MFHVVELSLYICIYIIINQFIKILQQIFLIDTNMVESLFMCIVTICVSDVFVIVLFVQTII